VGNPFTWRLVWYLNRGSKGLEIEPGHRNPRRPVVGLPKTIHMGRGSISRNLIRRGDKRGSKQYVAVKTQPSRSCTLVPIFPMDHL